MQVLLRIIGREEHGEDRHFRNRDWPEALPSAEAALREADVAIVTSYCRDAPAATELIVSNKHLLHVFYDLDTPVTLDRLDRGDSVEYLPPDGFAHFDLVLSFTGGRALGELHGSVDAAAHFPVAPRPHYAADLSYLGTYAADRQEGVERLFVGNARAHPGKRFRVLQRAFARRLALRGRRRAARRRHRVPPRPDAPRRSATTTSPFCASPSSAPSSSTPSSWTRAATCWRCR